MARRKKWKDAHVRGEKILHFNEAINLEKHLRGLYFIAHFTLLRALDLLLLMRVTSYFFYHDK